MAAEFGGRQAELTERARNYVSGGLTKCLVVAARAVAAAVQSGWETGMTQWSELAGMRPAGSPAPGAVRRAQVQVLDDLELWVTRLRSYRTALGVLPRIEADGDVAATLSGLVDNCRPRSSGFAGSSEDPATTRPPAPLSVSLTYPPVTGGG